MKPLILAGICVFISALSLAQDPNWTSAKIYFQEGDTAVGMVDFQDWNISPTTINVVYNGSTTTYGGLDVKGFTTNGRRYTIIKTDLKYYRPGPIKQTTSPVLKEEPVSVFAEVIYASHGLELYSLMDELKDERLFIKKDEVTRELVKYSILIEINGQTTTQTSNIYRSTLQALLTDCGVAVKPELQYSSKAIIPLLKSYSKCKGHAVELEGKERKSLLQLGASAGFLGGYGLRAGGEAFGIYSVDAQLLSERRLHNTLLWVSVGIPGVPQEDRGTTVLLSFRAGSYFGSGKVQSLAYAGISNGLTVHVGGGVALNKKLILTANYGLGVTIVTLGKAHLGSIELRVFIRKNR